MGRAGLGTDSGLPATCPRPAPQMPATCTCRSRTATTRARPLWPAPSPSLWARSVKLLPAPLLLAGWGGRQACRESHELAAMMHPGAARCPGPCPPRTPSPPPCLPAGHCVHHAQYSGQRHRHHCRRRAVGGQPRSPPMHLLPSRLAQPCALPLCSHGTSPTRASPCIILLHVSFIRCKHQGSGGINSSWPSCQTAPTAWAGGPPSPRCPTCQTASATPC